MSGATLAAGTKPIPPKIGDPMVGSRQAPDQMGGLMGSLTFMQLQMISFIIVLAASGLVPIEDLLFFAGISVYIIILSRLFFPPATDNPAPPVFQGNLFFRGYVSVGAIVGLFLPMAYVLGGFTRGEQRAVKAATPPLFLLACQIFTENLISGLSIFSLPVRALVPMLYNTRRLFAISEWAKQACFSHLTAVHQATSTCPFAQAMRYSTLACQTFARDVPSGHPVSPDVGFPLFGRALALANLVFWAFNLFCFLIPMFLPRAFQRHFELQQEAKEQSAKSDAEPPHTDNGQLPEKKGFLGGFMGSIPDQTGRQIQCSVGQQDQDMEFQRLSPARRALDGETARRSHMVQHTRESTR
eukprot:SM000212S06921  [mRNA]  locus=s212:196258:203658:- [translate_table: standard]